MDFTKIPSPGFVLDERPISGIPGRIRAGLLLAAPSRPVSARNMYSAIICSAIVSRFTLIAKEKENDN